MINVVQPKTSSSTPSSFFKSKSSTLKRYNKNKLSLQENGKMSEFIMRQCMNNSN